MMLRCKSCNTRWLPGMIGYEEAVRIMGITGNVCCPDCHEVETFKKSNIKRKDGYLTWIAK